MVLYRKVFPLDKDVSFLDYINMLRKMYFHNFVLTIDKIPATENYRAELFFTAPYWRWGLANGVLDGVFLKKCIIQPFRDEKYFILQVSTKTENLFLVSVQVLSAIVSLAFMIFVIITNRGMSLNTVWGLAIITIVLLIPLLSTYLRDKNLWDKVGSLGREIKKK